MAKQLGRNAVIAVSSNGVTYTDVGNVLSISFDVATDKAESTDADSGGAKEELQTDEQASLDITARYNVADAGQLLLFAEEAAKAVLYYRVRPKEATGEREWVFQGNLNSLSVSAPYADVEELSVSVTSTGAITRATQA